MADHHADHVFLHGVRDHHAALFSVARKTFGSQPLAGGSPLQILVVDVQASLPTFIVDGRRQVGHGRGVRVSLGCYIEPMFASFTDHLQHLAGRVGAHAVDVDHVQRSTADGGGCQHFFETEHAARFYRSTVPDMHVCRRMELAGRAEHLDDLPVAGGRYVHHAEAYARPARLEAVADPQLTLGLCAPTA